jgi:hypothetical protein
MSRRIPISKIFFTAAIVAFVVLTMTSRVSRLYIHPIQSQWIHLDHRRIRLRDAAMLVAAADGSVWRLQPHLATYVCLEDAPLYVGSTKAAGLFSRAPPFYPSA